MSKKIFFGNYKGGVGKTTSVFYLAKYFAELMENDERYSKKKVLILDLDPQCSMSEVCVRSSDQDITLDQIKDNETLNFMLHMYLKNKKYNGNLKFELDNIIKTCTKLNSKVDFIPTSLYYKKNWGLDGIIEELQKDTDQNILLIHKILDIVEDDYDIILFDCPPSNTILTKSAFLVSDYYVIPLIRDNISIKGVEHYIGTVDQIYNRFCIDHEDADLYDYIFKGKPKLLGLFECMRIRNENSRGTLVNLSNYKMYTTVIKNLIDIQEKMSEGKVSEEQGKYETLAKEIYQDF